MFDPWECVATDWPGWRIEVADIRPRRGLTIWATCTIVLDIGLTPTERRCTLTHELIHVERGSVPRDRWLKIREEREVRRLAAARLIDPERLADAMAWAQDPREIAEIVGVDVRTLQWVNTEARAQIWTSS